MRRKYQLHEDRIIDVESQCLASHLQSHLDEAPRPFARRNSNPAFQSKDGGNVFFIFPASSVVPSPPSANPGSLSADRFLDLRLSFSPFNRDRNMI
jgi:hypothetical protein